MPELLNGYTVDVEVPEWVSIDVEAPSGSDSSVSVVPVVGPTGPQGPAGPDTTAALNAHVDSTTPHIAAQSGRDFAAWYAAAITNP